MDMNMVITDGYGYDDADIGDDFTNDKGELCPRSRNSPMSVANW